MRGRSGGERNSRGPSPAPACGSDLRERRNAGSENGRYEGQIGLGILRLQSGAETDPVGKLDGNGRSDVVSLQAGVLSVKSACPCGVGKPVGQPERRVDRQAEPKSIRYLLGHVGVRRQGLQRAVADIGRKAERGSQRKNGGASLLGDVRQNPERSRLHGKASGLCDYCWIPEHGRQRSTGGDSGVGDPLSQRALTGLIESGSARNLSAQKTRDSCRSNKLRRKPLTKPGRAHRA